MTIEPAHMTLPTLAERAETIMRELGYLKNEVDRIERRRMDLHEEMRELRRRKRVVPYDWQS
jgi:hypothetical protein